MNPVIQKKWAIVVNVPASRAPTIEGRNALERVCLPSLLRSITPQLHFNTYKIPATILHTSQSPNCFRGLGCISVEAIQILLIDIDIKRPPNFNVMASNSATADKRLDKQDIPPIITIAKEVSSFSCLR